MMRLSSPSFRTGAPIPVQHTADGIGLSPALTWADLPAGVGSLVLLMEDPGFAGTFGPGTPFVHWILYNLQPSSAGIALGANRSGWPPGAGSGLNDNGRAGYAGPSPRERVEHRYVFRLLALDTTLNAALLGLPGRRELLAAVDGRVLDIAELVGTYRRPERQVKARP
jgi:Raf kinase inhibitor-like YbhB/YbcL family protein